MKPAAPGLAALLLPSKLATAQVTIGSPRRRPRLAAVQILCSSAFVGRYETANGPGSRSLFACQSL